jgi:hypothetical protein
MRRVSAILRRPEAGMTTAEYAVGTVAACGFAGVLYKILTSSEVISLVTNVISKALNLF